jgi:hypothetical protein
MPYKPAASLPAAIGNPDATIPEVMAFRHESARSVQRKIASGAYASYKSGDTRLILWASVIEDRERCLKRGPQLSARPVTGKRRPGRPRKGDANVAAAE